MSSDRHCAGLQGCERCKIDLVLVLGVMMLGSRGAKKQKTGRDKGSAEKGEGYHRDHGWGLQPSVWSMS